MNIFVANGLLVHGNDVSFQQPRRVNLHPQLGREPSKSFPNGRLFNQNPPKGPPLNPLVGFYGRLTPNSRMFMPPW